MATETKTGREGPVGREVERRPSVGRRPRHAARTGGLGLPRGFQQTMPGSAPGIELHDLAAHQNTRGAARITCIDYSATEVRFEEAADLAEFIDRHRPEWSEVRWINVDGLSDLGAVRLLAEKYSLHPLAIEDVLHVPQRPKVEAYEADGPFQARVFMIARMMQLVQGHIRSEQVSIFVGHKSLITFQESAGDIWDPIRARLRTPGSRLRRNDASFLAYTLIDAMVDHVF